MPSVNRLVLLVCAGVVVLPTPLAAQSLGSFRWQLLPYCNVITVNVTARDAVFALDGFDDQCGAGQRASVVGTAFLNPEGTVGIGLNTVLSPGAAFVHIEARISLGSLNGPWRDSAGNGGTLVFTPGAGTGGPPRPVAANAIAPGSITGAQLAQGTITAAQLAPGTIGGGQVDPNQMQVRIGGTCPIGQYLRGINANGTVLCDPLLTPNVSTTVDDPAQAVGAFTSVAIGADRLPIISHYDATANALRVTHCGDATCPAGNISTTVDDPADAVGSYTSIAIGADGLPIISHRNDTLGALRVTHCGNAMCTVGNISATVDDPTGDVGYLSSIAIGGDGVPIISHWITRMGRSG